MKKTPEPPKGPEPRVVVENVSNGLLFVSLIVIIAIISLIVFLAI